MKLAQIQFCLLAALSAMLSACGGSDNAVSQQVQLAAAPVLMQAQPASPVTTSPSAPPSMVDGLAEEYRASAQRRAAAEQATATQPAYPQVPAAALELAQAPADVSLGTGEAYGRAR